MTQFLPPNLLALFAPRDALPYLPPVDKLPHEKKSNPYTGLAAFLLNFEVSFPYMNYFLFLLSLCVQFSIQKRLNPVCMHLTLYYFVRSPLRYHRIMNYVT